MKKYNVLASLIFAGIAIASAQQGGSRPTDTSLQGEAGVQIKKEMHEMRDMHASNTAERAEIKDERMGIMNERRDMHASNTKERMDMRMEKHEDMRNATSGEEKRGIMQEMKGKREDMRASNTEERKELKQKSKDIAKERLSTIVNRLDMMDEHLQNALSRINVFIDNHNASSTATGGMISKSSPLLAKAVISGTAAHAAVMNVHVYANASTTLDVGTKELAKQSVMTAQEALKTFQVDLKAAVKDMVATYDLKANKK